MLQAAAGFRMQTQKVCCGKPLRLVFDKAQGGSCGGTPGEAGECAKPSPARYDKRVPGRPYNLTTDAAYAPRSL